jgi:hypothetical protein
MSRDLILSCFVDNFGDVLHLYLSVYGNASNKSNVLPQTQRRKPPVVLDNPLMAAPPPCSQREEGSTGNNYVLEII